MGGGDCGYRFSREQKDGYLVYCHQSRNAAALSTNICTRTRLITQAKGDLEAIGKAKPPAGAKGE